MKWATHFYAKKTPELFNGYTYAMTQQGSLRHCVYLSLSLFTWDEVAAIAFTPQQRSDPI